MNEVKGIHPYADKFPMLPESELEELAESIRENGQRQPIVLTTDGLILDGRNRYKACELINLEPETIVYDGDDLAEYVIDSNSSRRHMSNGARAMANALVLHADGKRKNGRWSYGRLNSNDLGNSMAEYVRQSGIILDFAPELAEQVVSGDIALDAAFKAAEQARDAERHRLEREERIKVEESDAKNFIEQNAPDLAEQVGEFFRTFSEARAVWEKRNREEAERLAYEKAAKEKQAREERQSLVDVFSSSIGKSLRSLGHYGAFDEPIAAMEKFEWSLLDPPRLEKAYGLDNLLNVQKFIDALIEWRKQQ